MEPRGFSLMELMIVVVIIAVMSIMALPGWGGFLSKKAMEHQRDMIVGLLNDARFSAMKHGYVCRVVFLPGERKYYCFEDNNANGSRDAGEILSGPYGLEGGIEFGSLAPDGPNGTRIPGDGVSFVNNRVSFSPMGCSNAGTIYIRDKNTSIALRVLPAAGTPLCFRYMGSWRREG